LIRLGVAGRRNMAAALPKFLKLNDARQRKNDLFASLTPFEITVLDTITHGGSVFGGPQCPRIVVSPKHGNTKGQYTVEGGMTEINSLVRAGWLRFANLTGDESGWFWLTDNAKRLWDVLGR
jgi:hypothetical protein